MILLALLLNGTPLESALQKPAQVKKLALSKQSLESIPADIGKLKKLSDLDLSYNPITELPAEISDLPLESLSLRCTKLKKLPDTFGKLTKLKRLDLSSAMDCEDIFRMTPAVAAILGKLTALTELRIAFMHIKALPAEVAKLSALRVLDLSYNEMNVLPVLPSTLEDVDISGNELSKLPDLSSLKKLKKLALGGQRGKTSISNEQIEELKKLLPKAKIISE